MPARHHYASRTIRTGRHAGHHRRASGAAAPPAFSPLDLTPALWVDPSDAATVTISGSSGAYIGANGLVLSGANSNYATTPNLTTHNVTGDIDLIAKLIATDWTPAIASYVVSKWSSGAGYGLQLGVAGVITLYYGLGGGLTVNSTAANTFTDGTSGWIRATRASASGDVNFYTSTDGVSWTQLGTTVSTTAGALGTATNGVFVGTLTGGGANFVGTVQRAIIKNGIGGTTVFDADFDAATPFVSAFTEGALGAPVYVVSSTATSSTASYGYVGPTGFISGGGVNYASAPSIAAYDITADFDIIAKVSTPDWTPSAAQGIASKAQSGTSGWALELATNGKLTFSLPGVISVSSSVATGLTDGSTKWVRVTRNGTTGDVNFYLGDDGSSWTQLGTTVAAATTAANVSTQTLRVGYFGSTGSPWFGVIMRVIVKNGIGGTTVFDADFTTAADYCTSFTESSSNAATVTITATNTPANAAGACVSQINDKSGNARHLTQGTLANMPKYWNGQNGCNVLVFDGTNDYLNYALTVIAAQPNTTHSVFRMVSNVASRHPIDSNDGTTGRQLVTSNTTWQIYAGTSLNSGVAGDTTTWHQPTALFNGASSKLRVDGVQVASGNAGTNVLTNLLVGAGNTPLAAACHVGEIFISAADNSGSTTAESYMKSKWGTP